MKHLLLYLFLLLSSVNLFSQDFNIGSQRNLSTCSVYFYDAGGATGFAGNDYQISTIHAESNACIGITFETFDLGFGAELKIYQGTNPATGILLGTYSGTNKPPVFSAQDLTFEYIPPIINTGNIPGWKAYLRCKNCDTNPVRTDPASDCVGAIPLCSNSTVIVSTNQYTDTGVNTSEEQGSCFSGTGSGGSVWYSFSPQTNGNLDFSITPSASSDYDFVLFDATNGCASLSEMSCNYSGTYANTGLTTNFATYSNSFSSCSGTNYSNYYSASASCGTWNEAEAVNTTHTYMLMVNFYSGSNGGFTLHFQNDAGTVSITDNTPPTLASVTQPGCNGSQIHVTTSENINCTTLQASDFTIPGYTISLANSGCVNGMTTAFDLTVTPPLPAGNYTLSGITCNDMCGNPLNDSYAFSIVIPPLSVVVTGSDCCSGSITTLTATPTGGSTYTYLWDHSGGTGSTMTANAAGTYCVTVTDACSLTATGCKTINIIPTPVINTATVCNGSNATLSVTGCTGTIQWQEWGTIPSTTPITNAAECTACGGSPLTVFGVYISCSIGGSCPTTIPGWVNTGTATSSITVSPPYASQYQAICTVGGGCSAQSTVLVNCAPPLSVTVNSATICAGNNTNITATPTGGTGSYTYSWNPGTVSGAGPNIVNPASTTTYYVTVTDGAGNTASASGVVTVNAIPAVNAGADQTVCQNTIVTLSGSGATSFSWDNGVTNGTPFTPLATTTYNVTGTDANSCSNTDAVVLTVNNLPNVNAGSDQTVCPSTLVTLSGSGVTSFIWNNGVTNGTPFTPIATTTYTVTGTDGNSCSNTDQVVVTVSNSLVVEAGPNVSLCLNDSVQLSATGGTNFIWSPVTGLSSSTIYNPYVKPLTSTTYSVTVSNNGCSGIDTVVVTVNNLPNVDGGNPQTVCAGISVSLSVTGATTFIWDNGITNGTPFTPPATATYTVTGTDVNSCSNTDQVVVTINPLPTINAGADQTVCAGTSVLVSGSGATTIIWDNGITNGTPFIPLTTTTYTVTGTDGNSCSNTDQVIININSLPVVSAGIDQSVCPATSVTLSGSGATNYTWDNGITNGTPFTPLATTTYSVTGTDVNSCSQTDNLIITVNSIPNANAGESQTICLGFSATLTATGGTSYNWNTNDSTASIIVSPVLSTTYSVTVTQNGCSASDTAVVYVNSFTNPPSLTSLEACEGSIIPDLSATATGTVNWYDDSTLTNLMGTGFTFNTGLTNTGTYFFYATQTINGCTSLAAMDTLIINPLPIVSFSGLSPDYCINGAISTLVGAPLGGTYAGPGIVSSTFNPALAGVGGLYTIIYSYTNLSTGCTDTAVHSTLVNNIPSLSFVGLLPSYCEQAAPVTLTGNPTGGIFGGTGVIDSTFDPSAPGLGLHTITYTYTDGNGCINSIIRNVTITAVPIVVLTKPDSVCANSNPVILSGGTPIGGIYSGNIGVTSGIFDPAVGAGQYDIYYTYNNDGCVGVDTATITVNPLPVVFLSPLPNVCVYVPAFTLTQGNPFGGSYSGDGVIANQFIPDSAGVGNHLITYTYTDSLGCTISNQQNITVTVYPIPTSSFTLDDIVCFGEPDTIKYTGSASQDATYEWDFGLDASSTSISTNEYAVIWNSSGVKNVSLIVHENGCDSPISIDTVTVVEVNGYVVSKTNLLCNGDSSGSALINANGGTFPFTFIWNNGQNDDLATNLAANFVYIATITDFNQCSDTLMLLLSEPPVLFATLTGTNIKCFGGNDGCAYSTVFGGTNPYSYLWNTAPGQTVDSACGLFADIEYLLVVTDSNHCVDTASIFLDQPALFTLNVSHDTIVCPGSQVNLIATASGGTLTYSYSWDNNLGVGNSHLVTPISNTTYSVNAIDAMNCSAGPKTIAVNIYPPLTAKFNPIGPLSICKYDSVLLNINVTGSNSSAYNFIWNNGLNNLIPPVSISPTNSTTYFVTVSDPCSFPVTDSIRINVNPLPTPLFNSDVTDGCKPLTINFSDSSTNIIQQWIWNFGDNGSSSLQNPNHLYTNTGFYDVSLDVTDTNGCKQGITTQQYIKVYPSPIANYYYYSPVGATILESNTQFYEQSEAANYWLWDFGDTLKSKPDTSNAQNPMYEFIYPGTYNVCLKVTNEYGCIDTACQKITLKPDYTFYLPNAFTPQNKDGLNDVFGPIGIGFDIIEFEMQIFDRWGEQIYVTTDKDKPWNGCVKGSNTIAPMGVYVYLVSGKIKDGDDFNLIGSVTLVK